MTENEKQLKMKAYEEAVDALREKEQEWFVANAKLRDASEVARRLLREVKAAEKKVYSFG